MSGIVGSRFNMRGSGLVGSLGTDGQVFTSSGAGAGAVFEAAAGGGKILQIQSATLTSTFVTNDDSSFVDVGLEDDITPASTSNKIFVYLYSGGMGRDAYVGECGRIKILRDGSDNFGGENTFYTSTYSGNYSGLQATFAYIDEPSSTSALTYKVQMQCRLGNNVSFADGAPNAPATLILWEIEG